jgi:D-arabinose 1-dehydrogenase-like Zn-dependent alcohol dehydrogenase
MPKMRAVQVSRAGGPLEMVERGDPVAAAGYVAVARGGQRHLPLRRADQGGSLSGHRVSARARARGRGVVDEVGDGIRWWKPGDRVGIGWHGGHCGECDSCRPRRLPDVPR